jgi:beta-RFAP synthase
MVEAPCLNLVARPAAEWSAVGPRAERTLAFVRRFVANLPADAVPAQQLEVEHCPPEHVGLGSGTQLGMAVAAALANLAGLTLTAPELALRVGRGARSGIGVHGFMHGGLLVDGGKSAAAGIAPLIARLTFPASWRVVLVLPPWKIGRHGTEELEAFQVLQTRGASETITDRLARLLLLDVLPAVVEQDLTAFGDALYEFNALSGELFAPIQGGAYASAQVEELIAFLRRQGVRGVGQSSWGPAVFAVVEDAQRGEQLVSLLVKRFVLDRGAVIVTAVNHGGAVVEC